MWLKEVNMSNSEALIVAFEGDVAKSSYLARYQLAHDVVKVG
jgi:hypothetical protein